jgi:tRNA nucleotidyltransferase (CCA-adding enzyme)
VTDRDNLAHELRALDRLAPVFAAVAAASASVDGVYLVGGTVRDILLGEPSFDVDIAVEGDAIAIARRLAERLGGSVRVHQQFGTAIVFYAGGERIDVVTARRESYVAPGALPEVEHAALHDDLHRRDFTVNAMAVSLGSDDFGRLVDPFGGRADLDTKTLRVLHERSFVDDPTRIFRGIRYENRYGFRMDDETASLARACVDAGLIAGLSGARLRDELVLLLEEDTTIDHSLERLRELGLAGEILPGLAADTETAAIVHRARRLADEIGLGVPEWRIGLAALGRHVHGPALRAWLERLRVRRRDAELIAGAVTVAPKLVDAAQNDAAPSELAALAEPAFPDAPLLALALDDLQALRRFVTELRHVRLEITGADLAALGLPESPRVGDILGELRRRKLDGELEGGREAELAAAKGLIAAA